MTLTFFEARAAEDGEARLWNRFQLAQAGIGLSIDLATVPDLHLELLLKWAKERQEAAKNQR